ncbi:hypothetical protein [Haloprofundus salinisoli]|uniref:hypothetical protein n=1 Tax=Haloprofundus salinisoli TaxID=2876193 RepID=UPI001CCE8705|nr:hypothetical protein [Haloprofundus salinisoli]
MSTKTSSEDLLPEPDKLYELLISELEYLYNLGGVLARNKDSFRTKRAELQKMDSENWKLDITPNWVLPITGPEEQAQRQNARDFSKAEGFALIGGLIHVEDGTYDDYSLNLTLLAQGDTELRGSDENKHIDAPCCWGAESMQSSWRVAKRYHFDIDLGGDDESKPITHLQSGGAFKKKHLPTGIKHHEPHYCSTPLDKPRLTYPPMDPILILQILVTQYDSLNRIMVNTWNAQVQKAESTLWTKYYLHLSDIMGMQKRSETLDSYIENGT